LRVRLEPARGRERCGHLPHAPPGTLTESVQLAEPEMLIEVEAIAAVEHS